MTLITYLTRVHFADGVLEEAVWSELEASQRLNPLIIYDSDYTDTPVLERLFSSMPVRTRAQKFVQRDGAVTEQCALDVARSFHDSSCDCLIAFGSSAAIDLAKVARVAITHLSDLQGADADIHNQGLSTYTESDGGFRRIGPNLPDLIAIPGIAGFSSAINTSAAFQLKSGQHSTMNCSRLMPNVAICDPTLTLESSPVATASAGVAAISQCIEAITSRGYNPPAEGIAREGLRRAIKNLPLVLKPKVNQNARREMMAASLNAALALQKGLGASNAISNALQNVAGHTLDRGVLHRIALPLVLRFNEEEQNERLLPLKDLFSSDRCLCSQTSRSAARESASLSSSVVSFFDNLDLPDKFGQMGLKADHFQTAALLAQDDIASKTNPRPINSQHYLSIMQEAQ